MTGSLEDPLGDTWSYDFHTNSWKEIQGKGSSARGWHVMAADAETGKLVLFGGGASREECTDETWTFDPKADTWSQIDRSS